jgi:hypothetical protein
MRLPTLSSAELRPEPVLQLLLACSQLSLALLVVAKLTSMILTGCHGYSLPLQVRFAAPVYPGEVLEVRAWWDTPGASGKSSSGEPTQRIIFETHKPDGKRAITNALVEVAPVGWRAGGPQQPQLPKSASGVASKL